MSRPRLTVFVHPTSGEFCILRNPDGPPTGRQLQMLNAAGRLELVAQGEAQAITKAEAAAAIDELSTRCDDDDGGAAA
jgi:hypothetical protein